MIDVSTDSSGRLDQTLSCPFRIPVHGVTTFTVLRKLQALLINVIRINIQYPYINQKVQSSFRSHVQLLAKTKFTEVMRITSYKIPEDVLE